MNQTAETEKISACRDKLRTAAAIHQLLIELGRITRLAVPMILAQLGQVAMMATDLIFIGRIGPDALAATALAGRVYLVTFTIGQGLLAAMSPVIAQAFAGNDLALVRRSLVVGLWMALLVSLPIMAFSLCGEQVLLAFQQNTDTSRLAGQYLFGLAWGVAPALSFQAMRNFMAAVNTPEPILRITLAAVPVNALLVYIFIDGKLGLPRLELFGVGLATTLVNCGTLAAGLLYTKFRGPLSEYRLHLWRCDWRTMRQVISIGAPISMASLMSYGACSAATLLAGLISTDALAAHHIVLQLASILCMISSGVSIAAGVRVGHAAGRSDRRGVKRAGSVAMVVGVVITAVLTLGAIAARFGIAKLFLDDSRDGSDAAIALAAKLLVVGASFFVADAVANVALGSLRGLKDTRVPLLFAGIAYWLIGFSVSYVLSFNVNLGAVGIWIGLSIGAGVYAGLLLLRFQFLANRLAL
ncbi:MATE family efflux transporter [Bradyrhizobium sp. 177]|uniref:MATE family efflux transporter n=1 Tax=Bradyrhizobium sp. 177 TaxID=2782647 RepID=UPI001FF79143|nr:MATE family efflux transporter [Bradyrhizobium sp. 177]MCK1554477.1 MATE family efflux transporter [Bradyrhizobium sp. 177]